MVLLTSMLLVTATTGYSAGTRQAHWRRENSHHKRNAQQPPSQSFRACSRPCPVHKHQRSPTGLRHAAACSGMLQAVGGAWPSFPKAAKVAKTRPKQKGTHVLTHVLNTAVSFHGAFCYSSSTHFRLLSILLTHMIAKRRSVSMLVLRRSCVRMCPNKLRAEGSKERIPVCCGMLRHAPPPLVRATEKSQINTVPTPTVA